MGSQLIALSILSRFWFPNVQLWVFASGYASLSIIVVLTGSNGFDRVEILLAIIKTAAIIMFIILAGAALFGWIDGDVNIREFPIQQQSSFLEGLWDFGNRSSMPFTPLEG